MLGSRERSVIPLRTIFTATGGNRKKLSSSESEDDDTEDEE